jgi:hypothetical protein
VSAVRMGVDAAITAAGTALAEHLNLGDRLCHADVGHRTVEAANYSLRARGLELEDAGSRGWVVQEVTCRESADKCEWCIGS